MQYSNRQIYLATVARVKDDLIHLKIPLNKQNPTQLGHGLYGRLLLPRLEALIRELAQAVQTIKERTEQLKQQQHISQLDGTDATTTTEESEQQHASPPDGTANAAAAEEPEQQRQHQPDSTAVHTSSTAHATPLPDNRPATPECKLTHANTQPVTGGGWPQQHPTHLPTPPNGTWVHPSTVGLYCEEQDGEHCGARAQRSAG
jgi:hypothetical protein